MESSDNMVSELEATYQDFCEQHKTASKPIIQKRGSLNFVGVRQGLESTLDFADLRANLRPILAVENNFNIVQVVGDSAAPFSDQGIDHALKVLSDHTSRNTAIEYGLTGKRGSANWIVNEFVRRKSGSSQPVIANVVGQAIGVLKRSKWKPTRKIQTFMVLYNEDATLTRFGDDIWLSDRLMSADCGDKMICFEGGPQSFRQAVNMLCNRMSIVACTGLRTSADGFSAAALLLELVQSNLTSFNEADAVIERHTAGRPLKTHQLQAIRSSTRRLVQMGSKLSGLVAKG